MTGIFCAWAITKQLFRGTGVQASDPCVCGSGPWNSAGPGEDEETGHALQLINLPLLGILAVTLLLSDTQQVATMFPLGISVCTTINWK